MRRYPDWMKKSFSPDSVSREVETLVSDLKLATVCQSAVCPNLRECYSQRQLTFMILGDVCTRSCRFCAVEHGRPQAVSPDEPWRVAEAVSRLQLRHVVITSVARDDLQDEGASHFVAVIQAVRQRNPGITVETLIPDFHGRETLLDCVLNEGKPEVFTHNVETIRRLSGLLRPQADYARSVSVLRHAALRRGSLVKSSIMVGLGEAEEELMETLRDLRQAGTTHLTIGQYLRPDAEHLPVIDYISPARFKQFERMAYEAGFAWVKAGPFVRSSYHAVDAIDALAANGLAPAASGRPNSFLN